MDMRLLLAAALTFVCSAVSAQGTKDNLPTGQQAPVIIQRPSQPSAPTSTPNRAADWGERQMYQPRIPRIPDPGRRRSNTR